MLKKLVTAVGVAAMVGTLILSGGGAATAAGLDPATTESPSDEATVPAEPTTPAAEPAEAAGATGPVLPDAGPSAVAEEPESPAAVPSAADEEPAEEEPAADEPAADEPDPSDVEAGEERQGRIYVSFNLDRLSLADGRVRNTTRGTASAVPSTVTGAATDVYNVTGQFNGPESKGLDLTTAYRIDQQLDEASTFWVSAHVYESRGSVWAECGVSNGDPDAGGEYATQFVCTPDYHQTFPNGKVTFNISMNRDAEATGIVKTVGKVSLLTGTFESEVPYHKDGTAEVPANSSTSFNVVLRQGDDPVGTKNAATGVFIYRIAENGTPSQFYVAGSIQTVRGGKFTPHSSCKVYDGDPRASSLPLAAQTAEAAAAFDCRSFPDRTIDWNGHHEFTFEVVRRQTTIVTNPLQQKALLSAHCTGDAVNCSYALATVTDTWGKGREVSARYNNATDVATSSTYAIGSSETITVTGGMEYAFGFEYDTFVWGKVTGSIKASWSKSTAKSTSTVSTYVIPIPAHHSGWLEATPAMVHTEGSIIVFDGARYFEMPNVSADLPAGGDRWDYTVRNAAFIGQEPGAGGGTGTPGGSVDLGSLTPGQGAAAPNTFDRTLARTGSDNVFASTLAVAALLGVGSLLLLVHRGSVRRGRRS
ncbi:MAG TPA: hypothetical protein VNJ54_07640 [Plantibacter sp.]|uniref:hypothetical protein n=1 Tax=unclassified Plantibacter TaxID=2624265 RepID=UPI002D09009D|nr:hypothetical protein [Plantibacter sp.]